MAQKICSGLKWEKNFGISLQNTNPPPQYALFDKNFFMSSFKGKTESENQSESVYHPQKSGYQNESESGYHPQKKTLKTPKICLTVQKICFIVT